MPLQNPYNSIGQREPRSPRAQLPRDWNPASGRIDARQSPETTTDYGGLNTFYALQDRRLPAFPKPGDRGWNASDVARRANSDRVRLGNGGLAMPDNPYITAMETHKDQYGNVLAGRAGDFGQNSNRPQAETPNQGPGPMTPDQRQWADNATMNQGTRGAIAGANKESTSMFGRAANALSGGMREATRVNPYLNTRDQNVRNAAVSGALPGVVDKFNADAPYGAKMNAVGDISRDAAAESRAQLQPMADKIAQRRRDEQLATRGGAEVTGRNAYGKTLALSANPYGTGSSVVLPPGTRGEGLVNDHMGRMVPANPYLAEQSKIQDEKEDDEEEPRQVEVGQPKKKEKERAV